MNRTFIYLKPESRKDIMIMKKLNICILLLLAVFSYAQENDPEYLAKKKAKNYIYEANELAENNNFIDAETKYRKAISEQPSNSIGAYNLAHSYYKKENFDEALYRTQEASKHAKTKDEKHQIFHNLGNILMKNKKCIEATEAFKNALRNNPNDEETRYNFALAKECAKQEQDKPQDENKDGDNNRDKDKKEGDDDKDKKDNNKDGENKDKDNKDKGDDDKKEGDDKKDEDGKPKDEKPNDKEEEKDKQGKGDKKNEQEKRQPQQGQLSPQQIKNLLDAMNNEEQKVQEKMNAEKIKGVKIQTDKDW